jgi:hypothetical protein
LAFGLQYVMIAIINGGGIAANPLAPSWLERSRMPLQAKLLLLAAFSGLFASFSFFMAARKDSARLDWILAGGSLVLAVILALAALTPAPAINAGQNNSNSGPLSFEPVPDNALPAAGLKYQRAVEAARSYWAKRGHDGRCQNGAKFFILHESYPTGQAFADCSIGLAKDFVQGWPWPVFCFVVVHEWGHLQGLWHTENEGTVMDIISSNPAAIQPPECSNPADIASFGVTMRG